MTGTITKRVDKSALTESTTKRVTVAATAGNTQRVTAAATADNEKTLGEDGGTGDTWKSTWGEVDSEDAGSGANTFFRTFKGWYSINRSQPRDQGEKHHLKDDVTETTQKRVTENPEV